MLIYYSTVYKFVCLTFLYGYYVDVYVDYYVDTTVVCVSVYYVVYVLFDSSKKAGSDYELLLSDSYDRF